MLRGQFGMITTFCQATVAVLLLAAPAAGMEPPGMSHSFVALPQAGAPVMVAPPGGHAAQAFTPHAGHSWSAASKVPHGHPSDCKPCCRFCEKLAPGRPDWFALGRITCRTPPHPFWYGEAAVLGLHRNARGSNRPIATLGGPGNPVLSVDEAYPDFRAGGLARLGRMFTPKWGIEYTYLGTAAWNGDAAVRDAAPNAEGGLGNLFSPFGQFGVDPVAGFDFNDFVSIRGRSQIDSHELSLRQRLCMPPEPLQISVFYGIRYLNLDERFGYHSESEVPLPAGASQSVDVRAKNDLLGVQLGTLLELHVDPRWWVDVRMSAGLYRNRAAQTTVYQQTGALPAGNLLESSNEHGTVGAEVSLACAYAVHQHLTIRVGYHFLWLDRVALAAENFETNPVLLQNGPGQLDVSGTIIFHGPFLGAAMAW